MDVACAVERRLSTAHATSVKSGNSRRSETSEWDRRREDVGLKKQMEILASGIVNSGGLATASQSGTES